MVSDRKTEALKTLLDSARAIVDNLADGSMERALRALADLPAQERGVIALALDRAVTAWRANEAFAPLHRVRHEAPRSAHASRGTRHLGPAIANALPMLTAEEWTNCVQFLERALAAISARRPGSETSDEGDGGRVPPTEDAGHDRKAGR